MTGAPVCDPLDDHLITPENAAFLFIDYQPSRLATIRSMDPALLLKNAVSTLRGIKTFGVPVVHSTVNVAGESVAVVVGAGELGSATATLLAGAGFPVVAVDCTPHWTSCPRASLARRATRPGMPCAPAPPIGASTPPAAELSRASYLHHRLRRRTRPRRRRCPHQ
jgi:hypothetical protein